MGFKAPLFVLGLSSSQVAQGGFVTPIPVLNMGATSKKVGAYRGKSDLQKQIVREDEEIMALIMVFLEIHL